MNTLELRKSLLSPPGDTLQEHIEHIGMSQAELAERMGRSIPKLNELIKGKAPLSKDTALKLEYVLNIPASFWLNREQEYQEELLEIEKLEFLESNESWLNGFPIPMLKKLNLITQSNKKTELVDSLLKFFRVASPVEWSSVYEHQSLAFKIDLKHQIDPKSIATWLRIGEYQAEKIELMDFDKKKLTESLPKIQSICFQPPKNWMKELQNVFASFGVALVYTPSVPKAPIYGAARWIKNKSIPLIQLTDRQKDYNAFWFSLYHELAHIRYHNKSEIFIEGIESIEPNPEKEKEADDFASKIMMSESALIQLKNEEFKSIQSLENFSNKFKINISILVSQLQRIKKLSYNDFKVNRLKIKVDFEEFIDPILYLCTLIITI
jgi:addiction module HigA family antidote